MAQGWESKSVESQQAEKAQAAESAAAEAPLSNAQKSAAATVIRVNIAADADRKRQLQGLHLQRERILSERTSNPHRRTALATALADIEEKLTELGWTLHL